MSRQPRNQGQPAPATTTRQNEYFVPRDGIDREVISADICRYLGNDALVRPGHYENPQNGQVVQGYYITAYRNLTTAMIEDLKADSARWDSERRAQTSRNTSGVQYRQSETHQSRQHRGPTEGPYQADLYARDSGYENPRYPGTGAPGYTGATGSFPSQQPPPPPPPPQQQQQQQQQHQPQQSQPQPMGANPIQAQMQSHARQIYGRLMQGAIAKFGGPENIPQDAIDKMKQTSYAQAQQVLQQTMAQRRAHQQIMMQQQQQAAMQGMGGMMGHQGM